MVLIFGGAAYGLWTYRQNKPVPMWVPLAINPKLPDDKRKEIVADLKEKLSERDRLLTVSKEMNLAKEWGLPSPEAAAAELKNRIFVKLGAMDSEMGRVDAIHIGVKGKRKDQQLCGNIAVRLMADVWKILGIEPPKKQ